MMKPDNLLQLINRPEGPTLEFKREFYALDDPKQEKKKRQKDEMLKDLLALANGSTDTAGDIAYLIIGVSEDISPSGERVIYGVPDGLPDGNDLLKMVRAVSEPPVPHILTEYMPVGEQKVYVITIPPSPYLHETKRKFETSDCEYSPYTVFFRRNSMVDIANYRERKALEDLKTFRASERASISNVLVGALIGSLLSGSFLGRNAEKVTGKPISKPVSWGTGIVMGGLIGGALAYDLKNFHEIIRDIRYQLLRRKKTRS